MISASHLQRNLAAIFRLAQKTGMVFKMHFRDRIFLINIEPTGERYDRARWAPHKKMRARKKAVNIVLDDCKICGGVSISGMCLRKSCPTNNKKATAEEINPVAVEQKTVD